MTRRIPTVKIGVDLPVDLVEAIDAYVEANPKMLKREIHENALRKWLIEQARVGA